MEPEVNPLRYFEYLRETSKSVDKQVLITNFIEDILAGRVLSFNSVAHDPLVALSQPGLSIYCSAVCEYRRMSHGSFLITCYGRSVGRLTNIDWGLMVDHVKSAQASSAYDWELEPDSVVLPSPSRAAIVMVIDGVDLEPMFFFPRSLWTYQGFVLLNRALLVQRDGLDASDFLTHEQENDFQLPPPEPA